MVDCHHHHLLHRLLAPDVTKQLSDCETPDKLSVALLLSILKGILSQ